MSTAAAVASRPSAEDAAGRKEEFLTFTLGAEEYAIDILKVREIRGYDQVTTIAHAPAFIKGVINLRGVIVPIVDLRIKFGLGNVEYTPFTVVIILNVGGRVVGIVVDAVSEVAALDAGDILPAPTFSARLDTGHIRGLAGIGERMLIVLDIEKLMLSADMALTDQADD